MRANRCLKRGQVFEGLAHAGSRGLQVGDRALGKGPVNCDACRCCRPARRRQLPRRDRKIPQVESAKGSRSHQGDRPNALDDRRRITQPHKDVDPERGIVCLSGLQPRKQAVPVAFDQPAQHSQAIAQTREPVAVEQGSRQAKHNPQVFGLAQECSGVLGDRVPVRLLRRYHRASHLLLRPALHQALKLQKRRIVLKVSPAGSRGGDRLQEGLDPAGENHARLIGSRGRRLREKVRGGRDGAIRADSFHQMVP